MIDVRPTGTLDAYALRACCRTNSFDQLRIDLTQCGFIRPAGLVFLGVCLEAATSMRTHRQIEADPQSEVAKYIDRLGLSTLARRCQAVGSQQLPVVRQHAADDRFIELTRFDSTGDTIIEDVCRIIRTRAGLWSADPQRLYNSIFELGYNVEQHAASTGLVAVQHYPNQRIVEFAVGDHGIGIEGL